MKFWLGIRIGLPRHQTGAEDRFLGRIEFATRRNCARFGRDLERGGRRRTIRRGRMIRPQMSWGFGNWGGRLRGSMRGLP
jgi:hypothetical protein